MLYLVKVSIYLNQKFVLILILSDYIFYKVLIIKLKSFIFSLSNYICFKYIYC